MHARHLVAIALAASLFSCLMDTGDPEALDAPDEPVEIAAQQTIPNTAITRLLMLRSDTEVASRVYPIVLTAPRASDTPEWSSAFRLICTDCKRALEAFGYSTEDASFAVVYRSLGALRSENQLNESVRLIDLPLEGTSMSSALLAAFRVVDASAPGEPRYLVRLRAAPETLFAVTCQNFLLAAQNGLTTVPVNKLLLTHWKVPAQLPIIGCSSIGGRVLPVPSAAGAIKPPLTFAPIEAVWRTTRPGPSLSGEAYPYVVAKDGNALRGFPVVCGGEAAEALSSLGLRIADIRSELATEQELTQTGFDNQPTIRCKGVGNAKILEITSSNDASKKKRFRFGDQRDLIEFNCRDTEAYWSRQATDRLADVPYEALRYLSDFDTGGGQTRIFKLGCRSAKLCEQIEPGSTPECPVPPPPDPVTKPVIPPDPMPRPQPPPVPPTPPLRNPGNAGCVYVQWCDYPNIDARAVCRTYAGCALNANTLNECRNDMRRVCGTPPAPNYFCNEASTNCQRL